MKRIETGGVKAIEYIALVSGNALSRTRRATWRVVREKLAPT
jgi:hypothetical protein